MPVPLEIPTNGEVYFTAITIVVSIILQEWIINNFKKADSLIKKFTALTWSVISVILLSFLLFFIYDFALVLLTLFINLAKNFF